MRMNAARRTHEMQQPTQRVCALLQAEAVRDCLGLPEIPRHDVSAQVEVLRLWIQVRPGR